MESPRTPAQAFGLLRWPVLVALGILTVAFNPVDFGTARDPAGSSSGRPAAGTRSCGWMGAIGVFASGRVDASRAYGMAAAIVLGVLAVWGFIDGG